MSISDSVRLGRERSASSARPSRLAALVTVALGVIGFLSGDAAMVAVCAVARSAVPGGVVWAWLAAVTVVGLGSYGIFGWPQLRAWSRTEVQPTPGADDLRTRWARRLLASGSSLLFVVASLIGGPLAIGWFYGRQHHPRAARFTAASALLLSAFWCAVYMGLLQKVT